MIYTFTIEYPSEVTVVKLLNNYITLLSEQL